MACSVKQCKELKRFRKDNISFHCFPKNDAIRMQWIKAIGKEDSWTPTKNQYMCSRHFRDCDYLCGRKTLKPYLKPDAIPSLYLCELSAQEEAIVADTSDINQGPSTSRQYTDENISITDGSLGKDSSADSTKIQREKQFKKRTVRQASALMSCSSSGCSGPKRKRLAISSKARDESFSTTDDSSGKSRKQTSKSRSSPDSSRKRRRALFVRNIHSYCKTPDEVYKKSKTVKKQLTVYKSRLYRAKKSIRKLKKNITNLQCVVNQLKNNNLVPENGLEHLQKCYDGVPAVLLSRYLKNVRNKTVTRETYPEILKVFASTLHFYSNRAYEFVRSEFALALPHPATLRKWTSNVDCSPGFITPAFDVLRIKVDQAKGENKEVLCSLIIDEMSIRKEIEFDGNKTWGYVDVGSYIENTGLDPATEVFVIMVVAHQSHWKLPIAYFFIKGLTGQEKANVVKEALIRLNESGIVITSVTCDGPSANFSMIKALGCQFENVFEIQSWFPHPINNNEKVFVILDPCHMLKLLRNCLASLQELKDPKGETVSWKFVSKLHELQDKEGLNLGNKIKTAHIQWYKQKMKVYLAAQTFSTSVADAIEYLNSEHHPDFQKSEATIAFFRRINNLFDILNSRSPHATGYKAPMRQTNEEHWRPYLVETIEYLLRCSDVGDRPLWLTPKKTPFLGFVITALSVCGIFDEFVANGRLSYFLTYKVSQDHLETYFCSVRNRNGWNNNPSALQFMRTFRKLLIHTKVSGRGGNCRVLDQTSILSISSSRQTKKKCESL